MPNACGNPDCAICAYLTAEEMEAVALRLPNGARWIHQPPPPGQPAVPSEEMRPTQQEMELVGAAISELEWMSDDSFNAGDGKDAADYMTAASAIKRLVEWVASLEAERDALLKSDIGYWMALAEERRGEIARLKRKAQEQITPFRGATTQREIL